MFSRLWPQVAGDRPEPDPDQQVSMSEIDDLFDAAPGDLGLPEEEVPAVAAAWFDAPHWYPSWTTSRSSSSTTPGSTGSG
jgi:hypothetical protein